MGLIMVLSMDSRVPTKWLLVWQMSGDIRRRGDRWKCMMMMMIMHGDDDQDDDGNDK